jgi:hypothetical protein
MNSIELKNNIKIPREPYVRSHTRPQHLNSDQRQSLTEQVVDSHFQIIEEVVNNVHADLLKLPDGKSRLEYIGNYLTEKSLKYFKDDITVRNLSGKVTQNRYIVVPFLHKLNNKSRVIYNCVSDIKLKEFTSNHLSGTVSLLPMLELISKLPYKENMIVIFSDVESTNGNYLDDNLLEKWLFDNEILTKELGICELTTALGNYLYYDLEGTSRPLIQKSGKSTYGFDRTGFDHFHVLPMRTQLSVDQLGALPYNDEYGEFIDIYDNVDVLRVMYRKRPDPEVCSRLIKEIILNHYDERSGFSSLI